MNDNALSELLEREPASIDLKTETYLTGNKVLVTGAGGSIGSYLCKVIAYAHPALLVLIGHGEDSINRIYGDLHSQFPDTEIEFAIASVAHEYQMLQLFEHHKPDYVFHAAAHKHVPLMETSEKEAVRNNVIGTYNVAQASGYVGVRQMVLISTDKAVDPYCVMGATKLLGEETMRVMSESWLNTAFTTVRFGNVLGSSGSVIPIFAKQIESGGPVTVTHPDMTRYFMTPTEAVSLVLQAGEFGTSGELYLLDMGEPFRITRLAENMIKFYGLEPYTGISIVFSGIRPGEKLTESLVASNEEIESTSHKHIQIVVKPDMLGFDEFSKILYRLRYESDCADNQTVRKTLFDVVQLLVEQRI